MIVREVKKSVRQITGWTEETAQNIINDCKTYVSFPGGPRVVDADDLKGVIVSRCSGSYFVWNKLASIVCINTEC
jgi:predicted naringenin-chalcone synthase